MDDKSICTIWRLIEQITEQGDWAEICKTKDGYRVIRSCRKAAGLVKADNPGFKS